jgi:hypothetical protein
MSVDKRWPSVMHQTLGHDTGSGFSFVKFHQGQIFAERSLAKPVSPSADDLLQP